MTITLHVKKSIGIGDALWFTTIPENYYKSTGKRVIDDTKHWVFDYNPYVIRDPEESIKSESKVFYGWNHNPRWKPDGRVCFTSMAEQHTGCLGIQCHIRHPRLYTFENFPFSERKRILLQTVGLSHGPMPKKIIEHVLKKYTGMELYHIGKPEDPDIGLPRLNTPTIWDLVREISQCRMIICLDSGPSWIAACYPDVIIKKVRTKPDMETLKDWVPLHVDNIHAIWDDLQLQHIYNIYEKDIGFTSSYLRI